MSQETDDIMAALAHVLKRLDHEARTLAAQRNEVLNERDEARAELRTRTQDCIRLMQEAQSLMRPQAEWEQEIDGLTRLARAVCVTARPHGDDCLVSAAPLRALERAVGEV